MKKFYEAPVVELTGFSAEDVITTSTIAPAAIDTASMDATAEAAFRAAVTPNYEAVQKYNASGSYNW